MEGWVHAAMDPSTPSGEILTRHSSFLRALARGLLGDEQLAEDAAQEAALAGLRRPPPAQVNPLAWFTTLTRRAALRIRRSAERREQRELAVARPEEQPGTVDALAQAEMLLRVAEAVVALPEPYRATILARYYEGWTPSAIALREHLPLSTVKSRLTRAHALLRERLDRSMPREASAWRADLSALVGLPAPSLLLPAIAMKTSAKLGWAAAALLALAAAGWRILDTDVPRTSDVERTTEVARIADAPLESTPAPQIQVERAVVVAPAAGKPGPLLLWGEIRGPTAEELAQSEIQFFDQQGNSRKATIGAQAAYSLFGLLAGEYRISARLEGFRPLDEKLLLPDGQPKFRHDLEFVRSLLLPVKLVDAQSGELLANLHREPILSNLSVAATFARPVRIDGVLGRQVAFSEAGCYREAGRLPRKTSESAERSGTLEVWAPTPIFASLVLREIVLESRSVVGDESELVFRVDRAALETHLGALEVRCVAAETGLPIPGQRVEVSFRDSSGNNAGECDEQGHARIERLTPGLRQVEVGGSKFAKFERWVRIEPGQTHDLGVIALESMADVRGRVLDPDGAGVSAPMHSIALERQLAPRDADSRMIYKSKSDGVFEMSWVESARVRLVAEPAQWALTALDVDASSGKLGGLELRLERGTEVKLRLAGEQQRSVEFLLADADGLPLLFDGVYGWKGRRLLLRPGRYSLSTVAEDRVLATQTLEVGDASQPLSVELR